MGEAYHSEFNISHEELYSQMEKLKSENYHLKRQLAHKNNINKGQQKTIASLERKLKKHGETVQHYRNGRKRGARGFNG